MVPEFDLFNRVRFGYPGTAPGNPQFGVISGQFDDPRLMQFAPARVAPEALDLPADALRRDGVFRGAKPTIPRRLSAEA